MAELHHVAAVTTETQVGNTLAWMRAIDYPEWMAKGLCARQIDLPPDTWFPTAGPGINPTGRLGRMTKSPKAVCQECPVRQQCLEYALETNERHGVWGGLDQYERRALKARKGASA